MSYTYTTRKDIALSLEGRFTIGGGTSQFGPPVISDQLIDKVVEQVEAKVEAVLRKVYRLPLSGPQPLVASAVEKLVLCELFITHAIGEQQITSSTQGVDRSPAGAACRAGNNELQAIASGDVILPGETFIGGQDSAVLPSNFSGARVRSDLGTRDARAINW